MLYVTVLISYQSYADECIARPPLHNYAESVAAAGRSTICRHKFKCNYLGLSHRHIFSVPWSARLFIGQTSIFTSCFKLFMCANMQIRTGKKVKITISCEFGSAWATESKNSAPFVEYRVAIHRINGGKRAKSENCCCLALITLGSRLIGWLWAIFAIFHNRVAVS